MTTRHLHTHTSAVGSRNANAGVDSGFTPLSNSVGGSNGRVASRLYAGQSAKTAANGDNPTAPSLVFDGRNPALVKRSRSEGRRALRELCAKHTQREIAQRLGVTQQCIGEWCSAAARPGLANREALETAFGIPPDAWGALAPNWKRRRAYRTKGSNT